MKLIVKIRILMAAPQVSWDAQGSECGSYKPSTPDAPSIPASLFAVSLPVMESYLFPCSTHIALFGDRLIGIVII